MKQKIVVKVQMNCKKCRSKALEVAAASFGVESVGLEGQEKDRVVVIGDGVDPVCLTTCLRKKVGHADLVSVDEVKPEKEKEKEKPKPKPDPEPQPIITFCQPEFPQFLVYETVYDQKPPNCYQM